MGKLASFLLTTILVASLFDAVWATLRTNGHGTSATYRGCYVRYPGVMGGFRSLTTSDMTQQRCISYCKNRHFNFAGLELSDKCSCGHHLYRTARIMSRHCFMRCKGNHQEECGSFNGISVFQI